MLRTRVESQSLRLGKLSKVAQRTLGGDYGAGHVIESIGIL